MSEAGPPHAPPTRPQGSPGAHPGTTEVEPRTVPRPPSQAPPPPPPGRLPSWPAVPRVQPSGSDAPPTTSEATIMGSLVGVQGSPAALAYAVELESDISAPRPEALAQAPTQVQPPRTAQGYVTVAATHLEAPAGTQADMPFVHNADSFVASAFRVLRHKLREVGDPRTIAITSPGRREGKTYCAINLAMAMAEHGRSRVLLAEANLRSPGMAAMLGFKPPACFGQQMAGHMRSPLSPWLVVAAFFPNLHVLAVDAQAEGQWRMSAPAFKLAIEQLKASGYEHIVIDCPSALGSADVNVIEDSADGVLFVARARHTRREDLLRARQHLAPANFFGVVLVDR